MDECIAKIAKAERYVPDNAFKFADKYISVLKLSNDGLSYKEIADELNRLRRPGWRGTPKEL